MSSHNITGGHFSVGLIGKAWAGIVARSFAALSATLTLHETITHVDVVLHNTI